MESSETQFIPESEAVADKLVGESLTFDDVLLMPGHSEVEPGLTSTETRLTRNIDLNIPVISAAMDKVTEWEMAVAMAREGGIGIIHRNLPIEVQVAQVERVKRAESAFISTPETVRPDTKIGEVRATRDRLGFSAFPVTDAGPHGKLLGMISRGNYRSASNDMKVGDLMRRLELVPVLPESATTEDAERQFKEIDLNQDEHEVNRLPVVDGEGNLRGLFTYKDVELRSQFPKSVKDENGRLIAGAGLGVDGDFLERATALIEAEVDVLSIDTAHVDTGKGFRCVKQLRELSSEVDLIAGNVVDNLAVERFIALGVDALKIGLGDGSICDTRIKTGVGRGQWKAIVESAAAAKGRVPVIADGGIRSPGDVAKAIGAGAESVMIGSLLAGTDESPGETIWRNGVKVAKEYRGMGSRAAMREGSANRYFTADENEERLPEGVEAEVRYRGPLAKVVKELVQGLEKSFYYTGSPSITELRNNARFERISPAGLAESYPHDVTVTKDNPLSL